MNQLDILISRETLPKARTMQEHDDKRDTPTSTTDNTNSSQFKAWEQRIEAEKTVVSWLVLTILYKILENFDFHSK